MDELTKQQIKENWITEEAFELHQHAGDFTPDAIVFPHSFVKRKLEEIEILRSQIDTLEFIIKDYEEKHGVM